MTDEAPTHCWACSHPVVDHDLQPDGTRPCRSPGHHKGVPCSGCRALLTPEHRAAIQDERKNDSFATAWGAYTVTLQDARNAFGEHAAVMFSDIHQSALASALIALRQHDGEAQLLGPGEPRYTMDTVTPEALHQLQVDRESAISDRDTYRHRAERWHAKYSQLKTASTVPDMEPPSPAEPEPRVPLAEHTEATLAELYDRVEDADADMAELRSVASEMYRAWKAAWEAAGQQAALAAGVHNALLSLRLRIRYANRDWDQNPTDAGLYALLMGWDCEQQHDHTGDCPAGLDATAAKHGWSADVGKALRRHRATLAQAGPNGETDAAAQRAVDGEED